MRKQIEEACPEAAALLQAAGWKPHDRWGVYTHDTLVMGFSPDGHYFDIKNWGLDVHGPDTPDDPIEAAQWLIRLRAPQQNIELTTESTLAPVVLGEHTEMDRGFESRPAPEITERDAPEVGGPDEEQSSSGAYPDLGAEILEEHDAEYQQLLLDADFVAAPEPPPPPQDRFYGLDDLDRRRSLRIGDVVRISRAKQAEVAALMGDHDFSVIQNAVIRDTVDGQYKGPQPTYDLFVELSRHQAAINRTKAAEADKVAFLEHASREQLEAFDAEADWL